MKLNSNRNRKQPLLELLGEIAEFLFVSMT